MPSYFTLKPGQILAGSNKVNDFDGPPQPDRYRIEKLLGRHGQRGTSYSAIVLESATLEARRPVFVKVPRVDLAEAHAVVTTELFKIDNSFVREASKQDELASVPCIAHVIDKGTISFDHLKYSIPFLVQEFVFGAPLRDFLVANYGTNGRFQGIESADDWFELATQITDVVRRVHNRGVVHGDIWPDNILMCERGRHGHDEPPVVGIGASETATNYLPYLVDFGDSILLQDEAIGQSRVRERPHSYMAPERNRSRGSWSIPADVYSLGGVLLFLATGEDPGVPTRSKDELKAEISARLGASNPKLTMANPGVAHIIDKCLRYEPYDRFFYADGVRNLLRNYDRRQQPSGDGQDLSGRSAQLTTSIEKLLVSKEHHQIFASLASSEVNRLIREVEAMNRGHVEIVGDRELIIDYLLSYLSVLSAGDEYITITSPQFWTERNLGTNGRFLTMNKVLAQSGVHIRRVFVLAKEERSNRELLEVLRTHLHAISDLPGDIDRSESGLPATRDRSFYTGYVEVDRETRNSVISEGAPVALWRKQTADGTEELVSIAFSTRPVHEMQSSRKRGGRGQSTEQQIGKVRIWASDRQTDTLRDFLRWLSDSKPLEEYGPLANVSSTLVAEPDGSDRRPPQKKRSRVDRKRPQRDTKESPAARPNHRS